MLGFSGTSSKGSGMVVPQFVTVKRLFHELRLHHIHHGDCTGADAQAHQMAMDMRVRITIHPPIDPKARAWCAGRDNELALPGSLIEVERVHPYMVRNFHIARSGVDGLIAAPPAPDEVIRGKGAGTWSTVRRARELKRPIWIVLPDGSIRYEIGTDWEGRPITWSPM